MPSCHNFCAARNKYVLTPWPDIAERGKKRRVRRFLIRHWKPDCRFHIHNIQGFSAHHNRNKYLRSLSRNQSLMSGDWLRSVHPSEWAQFQPKSKVLGIVGNQVPSREALDSMASREIWLDQQARINRLSGFRFNFLRKNQKSETKRNFQHILNDITW